MFKEQNMMALIFATAFLLLANCWNVQAKPIQGKTLQDEGLDDGLAYLENEDYLYDTEYEYDYADDYTTSMFTCFKGDEDVTVSVMCDGYNDCRDGSDEIWENCEEHQAILHSQPMQSTQTTNGVLHTTTSSAIFIPEIDEVKDIYLEYEDACDSEEFRCSSDPSICLPYTLICDGIHDCPDMEDEKNCTEEQTFGSPPVLAKTSVAPILASSNFAPDAKQEEPPELKVESDATNKRIIQFQHPPPSTPQPVFLQEEGHQNLNLEYEYDYYDYLILDRNGNIVNEGTGEEFAGNTDVSTPVSHELPVLEPSRNPEYKGDSKLLPTDDNQDTDSKRVSKEKKKIIMSTAQLLQQIRNLLVLHEESIYEDDDPPRTDIKLSIDTKPSQKVDGLYSRICSSKSGIRLNISIEF